MRSRAMGGLFSAVAAMNTAMVGVSTVATLIASDANGPQWSGLPNAAAVLGSAAGSLGMGAAIQRWGARSVLVVVYLSAALGAVIATGAALRNSLPVLAVGMVLLGMGQAGALLSRYVAAELYPVERQGFGLSIIVWAGTVGALAGPALIAPSARAVENLGLPGLSGPALVAIGLSVVAVGASILLPRLATHAAPQGRRNWKVLRHNALVAMVCAHVVMVGVMTMTPLQLHDHGHGLGVIGGVLSAHMVGMFALAPLSGRLADRWGGQVGIAAGFATLLIATVLAAVNPERPAVLFFALFFLGYGWNLVFVGGSKMLSAQLAPAERGAVDAVIWMGSAAASVIAGQVFAWGGYDLVGVIAAIMALAQLIAAARRRPARRLTSTVDEPVARL